MHKTLVQILSVPPITWWPFKISAPDSMSNYIRMRQMPSLLNTMVSTENSCVCVCVCNYLLVFINVQAHKSVSELAVAYHFIIFFYFTLNFKK